MKKYPLFKVHIPKDEALANIKEVFESGFINEGLQVTQLTDALQHRFETPNVCLTNSCTSALTIALKLCEQKSDWLYSGETEPFDVITTSMTCVATNMPIITTGNNIIWADVEPNTGMLDPNSVDQILTRLKRPAPVIAVAWAGTPPKLNTLRKVCDRHGSKLILDAAHAFDARYDNKPIHSISDYTTYSFQAIKHLTTGDGGALVCKNGSDHQLAKDRKSTRLNSSH